MMSVQWEIVAGFSFLIAGVISALVFHMARHTSVQVDKAVLSIEREYAEKINSELQSRLQQSEERIRELNRLVFESIEKSTLPSAETNLNAINIAKRSRFLKLLGINTEDLRIELRSIFFLTPLSRIYEPEWHSVREVCSARGFSVRRGNETFVSGNLLRHIVQEIITSNLIIVNISGRNPNVFYELGIAQMLEKRVIMIAKASEKLQFDVNQQQVVLYHDMPELVFMLNEKLSSAFIDAPA
jgi:hypothetical protein